MILLLLSKRVCIMLLINCTMNFVAQSPFAERVEVRRNRNSFFYFHRNIVYRLSPTLLTTPLDNRKLRHSNARSLILSANIFEIRLYLILDIFLFLVNSVLYICKTIFNLHLKHLKNISWNIINLINSFTP